MSFKSRLNKLKTFYSRDIWNLDLNKFPFYKRAYFTTAKVILLGLIGLRDDQVTLRASALTYFTLLSIVPVLAMAFGIAKGFGLDKVLEDFIIENFEGQEAIFNQSLDFAKNLLETTKGGLVAGVGLIFLFYAVMRLLNNIEEAFNGIWYIHEERNLTRKLTDYITIMLVGPILLLISNSLTVYISSVIANLTSSVGFLSLFQGLIFPLLNLLPFTVLWLLFTLLYMIMPNTTVNLKAGLIAGIIAGTLFHIVEILLFNFGLNMSRYNAIYGSFAALPLFLIWLQISWMIVLFGSELSYAIQNVQSYETNKKGEGFSINFKKKLALAVSMLVVQNFKDGKQALTLSDINAALKVPNKLLQEVFEILIGCNILAEVKTKDSSQALQPAVDTELLSVAYILNRFEKHGNIEDMESTNKEFNLAGETINSINEIIGKSGANKLLKVMV